MDVTALPFIDEHSTIVAAEAAEIWPVLGETLERSFTRPRFARYARLVGAADRTASGSAFPGFRVAEADPGRELVLIGRHHFATYALVFHLDAAEVGRTRLRAETRARFPGPFGALYRLLVIESGAHTLVTGRLLAAVRRRAE